MKRIIALVLACCLLLSACGQTVNSDFSSKTEVTPSADNLTSSQEGHPKVEEADFSGDVSTASTEFHTIIPEYNNLDDPELLNYVEDSVYVELVSNLDDGYFAQNVNAVYVSEEYLEEISYNSKSNIFFGYTLAELDEQFQGTRYVFTLSDEGETIVEPFEEYDDTYESVIKNVAIGSGVILICATVSVVSGGIGAPAISIVFATSAKTGAIMALSSGGIGAAASGIVTGVQTKDLDEAVKAAALAGSEGFKWGAISGALTGGTNGAIQVSALKGADVTANGLTLKEAAAIQNESKYPLDVIKQMHSMEEYQVYKEAGLKAVIVDGKTALIQNIDINYISELPDGTEVTNLIRMQNGYAPIDPLTNEAYQLHHIGQKADATLAVLTPEQHQGNSAILNIIGKESEINRSEFDKVRKDFWEYMGKYIFCLKRCLRHAYNFTTSSIKTELYLRQRSR